MLGQPVSMLIPNVVGFRLAGEMAPGTTATDLVLTVTEMLRSHGVVGKFVEFYGEGVAAVPLADRATIGNMSPEYGSTCAIFPIDAETLHYLRLHRPLRRARRPRRGLRQGAGPVARPRPHEPDFSETLELDLATIEPSLAGPKRPQDRVPLRVAKAAFRQCPARGRAGAGARRAGRGVRGVVPGQRPGRCVRAEAVRPRRRVRRRRNTSRPTSARGRPSGPRRCGWRRAPKPSSTTARWSSPRSPAARTRRNPSGHGRRRPAREERRGAGPDPQALGEDLARARVEGRHGLLRGGRPHPLPGEARLLPRRVRLHDLHRQLRPAARRGRRGRPPG